MKKGLCTNNFFGASQFLFCAILHPAWPEGLCEDVPGNELTPAAQQDPHEGAHQPLAERARRDLLPVAEREETAQQPDFDAHSLPPPSTNDYETTTGLSNDDYEITTLPR